MRIRSIKPDFWRSDDITNLSKDDRLLFIGLWSYVDDNGVGRDELAHILGDLFSHDWLRDPRETVASVSGGLSRLQTAGLIARYETDGKPYLHITTWEQHQRIDKPAKARYPLPDPHQDADPIVFAESSGESREELAPGAGEQGRRGEGTGEEGTGEKGAARKRATRIPEPFLVTADMRQWAAAEAPAVDVDRSTRTFVDYWRASAGRTATKQDWPATWRNWLRRDQDRMPGSKPAPGARESSLARRDRQVGQMFADLTALEASHPIGALEA